MVRLFSESNTRFLCEVEPDRAAAFEQVLSGIAFGKIGRVTDGARLEIVSDGANVIDADVFELKRSHSI